jgi:hypothetical protein
MRPRLWRVAVAVGALATLTACAAGGVSESDAVALPVSPIADVKELTQTAESEVVEAIPRDYVTRIAQRPKGSLLSCRGDRNFRWAGGTDVRPVHGSDMQAAADELAESFLSRADWAVAQEISTFGHPRVIVRSPRGERFYVLFDEQEPMIYVDSFSVCFHLRDDESPHGFY